MNNKTKTLLSLLPVGMAAAVALGMSHLSSAGKKVQLDVARIYIEYNYSGNDLGFHVFLDGEDWKEIEIIHPDGQTIFEVEGEGGYGLLGMTELFFEGAEPSLDEVPLEVLLGLFPEGKYRIKGKTVEGLSLVGTATLSHKIPDAPVIISPAEGATVNTSDPLVISWQPVADPQGGKISGYQVIIESFQITLPASKTSVTVPPEFLEPGTEYEFEVLAIEAGGNQTIRESSFETE